MGVRRVDELFAFQLAHEFKLEVYRIAHATPSVIKDFRFRDQLFDSASGVESCIAEGFRRRSAAEFARFLRYALSSLEEAVTWLQDGVDRGHFQQPTIAPAGALAKRCRAASEALYRTQQGFKKPPPEPSRPRHPGAPGRRPVSDRRGSRGTDSDPTDDDRANRQ
jgi:four helix bundle protein